MGFHAAFRSINRIGVRCSEYTEGGTTVSKLLKKTLCVVLAVLSLFACIVPASAAGVNAYGNLSTSNAARTYTLKSSGITIPYTTKELKTRGTVNGAQSGAYVDNAADEIYIFSVGKNSSGVAYAYCSYPGTYKRVNAYFRLSDLIAETGFSHNCTTATGKFYLALRSNSGLNKSYWVDKGDPVYLLSSKSVDGKYQIMAPRGAGGYRIAWCTVSDYNAYCAAASKPTVKSSGTFAPQWPAQGATYLSTMGYYWNNGNPSQHGTRSNRWNAFDIAGTAGTKIVSVEAGKVVEAGWNNGGFGYCVTIEHANGLRSLYGHLQSAPLVSVGQTVNKGQLLGYMGSTGNSSGTHLHIELYNPVNYAQVVNPFMSYFQYDRSLLGKLTIGVNSMKANNAFASKDSNSAVWVKWLNDHCVKSNGDFIYKK